MDTKKVVIIVVIVLAIVLAFFTLRGGGSGQYDEFAKCLTSKGAKMYGAYWCGYCETQKKSFGSSWKHINYVECSLPNRGGQNQVCNSAGIRAYPTWEFAGGQRTEGQIPFSTLSQASGCPLK